MMPQKYAFVEKKFCVMVAANKKSYHPDELYTKRIATINHFNSYHPNEFDLYGFDWPTTLVVYKGTIDDKLGCMQAYKFSIAYENLSNVPGYITEKIFHCFTAGCVPIYWGANNITDYVPKSCFIDRRDFESDEEVYNYLKTMDKITYEKYLEHINDYLKTEQAHNFSNANFIALLKLNYLT